jgi:hypothetical protein
MRLSSISSSFVFNLPSDLLLKEIISTYTPLLEKNWVQYDNVLDYLNSTIKGTDFPGLSIETPFQTLKRGKQRAYKPATNVNDILTSRELNITFRSVDSHLNYMLLYDIFEKNYMDTDNLYVQPFLLTMVDIHRDAIYQIKFKEVILKSLSSIDLMYNNQQISEQTFVLTISFNFIDIEFMLNQSKVLELGRVPQIIQKL